MWYTQKHYDQDVRNGLYLALTQNDGAMHTDEEMIQRRLINLQDLLDRKKQLIYEPSTLAK